MSDPATPSAAPDAGIRPRPPTPAAGLVADDSGPVVELTDVVKSYAGDAPVQAVRGVSLSVRRGEIAALLGKSGSGKSTLLNLLGGLDKPTSGRVCIAGRDLSSMSSRQMAEYRLTTVGMVFQSFNLIPARTAWQNVALPLVLAGMPSAERRRRADAALQAVGLGARQDHCPNQLSGGEQQRVAIARALINNPPVLLADEPTGNLDSENAAAVLEILLDRVRRFGTTLVLVTHDEELARRCATRIFRLRDGQLVE